MKMYAPSRVAENVANEASVDAMMPNHCSSPGGGGGCACGDGGGVGGATTILKCRYVRSSARDRSGDAREPHGPKMHERVPGCHMTAPWRGVLSQTKRTHAAYNEGSDTQKAARGMH